MLTAVESIARSDARAELNTERAQLTFLCSWWSKTFNRPLKDPLLKEYTLEELYYEYRLRIENDKHEAEQAQNEADKIEDDKLNDALAWAEEEEKKEAEAGSEEGQPNLTEEDKAWMEQQMAAARAELGEDFGEDISEDFTDG